MTVHIHPSWEAPTSKLVFAGEGDDTLDFEYEITNCPSSGQAYTNLLAGNGEDWLGLPGLFEGCLLRDVTMAPDGPDAWRAKCAYSRAKIEKKEKEKLTSVGQYRVSFSSKSQSIKQYTAKSTVRYPEEGGMLLAAAPDFKGAINVNAEGEVEGVDAIVPCLTVSITQRMEGASLTPEYALLVSGLIGKYNNDTFMGFPEGTMQLTAADGALSFEIPNPNTEVGDPIPPQDRELSFEFLFSPNLTNISIGDVTGINKKGHQYMWTLWMDAIASGRVYRRPRAVYVQDLYGVEPADFSALRLTV